MKCAALILAAFGIPFAVRAEFAVEVGGGQLAIDAQGFVQLTLPDQSPWPVSTQPVVQMETATARLAPETVTTQDNVITATFAGSYECELTVTPHPNFLLFELTRLEPPADLQRIELFSLSLPREAELTSTLNGGRTATHVVTLASCELNVLAYSQTHGRQDSDRAGCTHELAPSDDAREGKTSARFTATCNGERAGWSFSGRSMPRPMDLTGCKAIRAWIHGDGKGEQLKIQLYDGLGGYRDTYFPIDFTGWQQVTVSDAPLNSLKADHVTAFNLYYNGLPANETVTCLVDGIEAVLERNGVEETVLLESFESPGSEFWAEPIHSVNLETLAAHGLQPARFGVLVSPIDVFASTMEAFEIASGLPSPHPGGVWNKRSPWVDRSYLFITGFRESQYEPVLAMAKRGGFDMILILQDSWTRSTGKYEVNTDAFPGGLDALVETVNKFKKEGFKVGLHFLAASIYPNDPYLTPVPDPRLVRDATAELAADIDVTSTEIPTVAPPDDFPAEDAGYMGSGTVIQIGDELISYGTRSVEAPFGFTNCQRGFHGTIAAAHAKGDPIRHVHRSYGYFLYDMDSTLINEVTANFARIANACDVDMLYFDGSEWLQGDHRYYNAKLHTSFFEKLDREDILLQASSFSHFSWHILGRTASADGHGDIKGYLDQRAPVFDSYERNFMPLDVGWYYGYDPTATPDMYEYILGATIGYDSSMSFQVSLDAANNHPFAGEILDLIRRYEELRLSDRVPDAMRALLRVDPSLAGRAPGEEQLPFLDKRREYRLLKQQGRDVFQRMVYTPWQDVSPADEATWTWSVTVPEDKTQIGIQFHLPKGPAVMPGDAYRASDAVVLETFDDVAAYTQASTFEGVTQEFSATPADAREGGSCVVYTATSTRSDTNGWSFIGRAFDTPVDISWHKAVGFWLRGDGNGGSFKLQLLDGSKAADYYISNDYSGWRYQQLARPATDPIDYADVRALNFYYNSIPANTRIVCAIDDVKALRALDESSVAQPSVEVDGNRVMCDSTLQAGQFALMYPGEPWRVYGPAFVEPTVGESELVYDLAPGQHNVRIHWEGALTSPMRARILLQPPEAHEVP